MDISEQVRFSELWSPRTNLNVHLRRKFIFEGHFKGASDFIEKYWKTIHQAAGWRALRSFLLVSSYCYRQGRFGAELRCAQMLMVNKYLNTSEVAKLLKQYEGNTGMDLWYK